MRNDQIGNCSQNSDERKIKRGVWEAHNLSAFGGWSTDNTDLSSPVSDEIKLCI